MQWVVIYRAKLQEKHNKSDPSMIAFSEEQTNLFPSARALRSHLHLCSIKKDISVHHGLSIKKQRIYIYFLVI